MDLLTRRKTAENIMGHECKNTEVGVGRDAQVEVIPWTMGRGGVDRSMEFDRMIPFSESALYWIGITCLIP